MPALVEAIGSGGLRPEVVAVGRAPAADSEVIPTSKGVRMSNVYLRGRAAGDEGRAVVRQAADRVGQIPNVFDRRDLQRLATSTDKMGDMAIEAEPPAPSAPTCRAAPLPPVGAAVTTRAARPSLGSRRLVAPSSTGTGFPGRRTRDGRGCLAEPADSP